MTVLPWLAKAGRFDVEHVGGIPHENASADFTAPPAAVLHTTEGGTIEGAMSVFRTHYAPQFVLGKDATGKVRILQLLQVGTLGLALEKHNALALVQVEMAGFSKETLWLPDDETGEALASLMAACKAEYGIPLSHPWADGDFGLAGYNTPHRHSGNFGKVAGWYGHGDIPDNQHWDPGDFRWSVIFTRAGAMPHASAAPTIAPPAPPRPCACGPHPAAPAPIPASPDLSTIEGLQRALVAIGAQIDIDGEFGPQTAAAIRAFQARAGLVTDGDVGPLTKAALAKALAK